MSEKSLAEPTQIVGANVRAETARKRVSQRQMGAALGISHASVSARLSGRTPIDINELVTMATLLEVPLATLLAGVIESASLEAVPA